MTAWDALLSLRAGLRADAGLAAWCQATYGRGLCIGLGFWLAESPGKESAPYALLAPAGGEEGQERAEKVISIRGLIGLHDKAEEDSGLDRVQLGAMRLAHEFAPRVLAALARSLGQGLSLAHVRTHDFSKAPVFELGLDLTVIHSRAVGARR